MIGAYITYCIIQSINIDNYKDRNLSIDVLREHVLQYLVKSVGDVVPYLVAKFQEFIVKVKEFSDLDLSKILLFEKDKIKRLLNAFCYLYPLLTYDFEKSRGKPYVFEKVIHDTYESSFEGYKRAKLEALKELKIREGCNHKFGKQEYNKITKWYIKKCSNCGLVKRVKR